MQKLEDRVVELASGGIFYPMTVPDILHIRDLSCVEEVRSFSCRSLGLKAFSSNDERLNDSGMNPKLYYLTAGNRERA